MVTCQQRGNDVNGEREDRAKDWAKLEQAGELVKTANQELRLRHITLFGARIEESSEKHRAACSLCSTATRLATFLEEKP